MKLLIILMMIGLMPASVHPHEPKHSDRSDIIHVLESYSQRTDTKFVLDPRVKGRVNMVGLEIEGLTQTNVLDILRIHNFTAYEKEGVVYVLPRTVVDYLDSGFGKLWGSN